VEKLQKLLNCDEKEKKKYWKKDRNKLVVNLFLQRLVGKSWLEIEENLKKLKIQRDL
jgi:hypothetical protein